MQIPELITIVSGLPRSGTSLMMQMLHAGGMPVLTDRIRSPDAANPRGYFELEAVKQTRYQSAWLADAPRHAVKVIYRLLYDLPADREYHVLFMQRDLAQVIDSQQVMLGKALTGNMERQRLMTIFQKELNALDSWLKGRSYLHLQPVPHSQLIHDPIPVIETIKSFLKYPLDTQAMCRVIDPRLHRQKAAV